MFGRKKKEKDEAITGTVGTVEDVEMAVKTADGSENGTTYDGSKEAPAQESASISEDTQNQPSPLTWKEAKALKRAKYEEKIAHNDKFGKAYVIRNKKTNQVVELRAASPVHAANIIGWKPRKIEVLNVRTIEDPSEEPETVGSSS